MTERQTGPNNIGVSLRRGDVWAVTLDYGGGRQEPAEVLVVTRNRRHVGVLLATDDSPRTYSYELPTRKIRQEGRAGCIIFNEKK